MKILAKVLLAKTSCNYSYGYEQQTSEQCTNSTYQCETSTNGSSSCVATLKNE